MLIIFIIFLIIIFRVFYIEVIDYKKLNKYASNLWSRNLPIKADRGIIYDRNGTILADNIISNTKSNKKQTRGCKKNIRNIKSRL